MAKEETLRVALIGTFAPRKCGIATFTTDVFEQLGNHHPEITMDVYALDRAGSNVPDERVCQVIDADDVGSYENAAQAINLSGVDCVWIQHEFGIFGPNEGEAICAFVDRIAAPLVFTFHTVLTDPSQRQRDIMKHLITRASRIMVMSQQGFDLLVKRYQARPEIIEIIPHGAPDRPFGRQEEAKASLGLAGRNVLMTFGLLSPGKGLEHVIEAMPAIIARHPNTVYRIVGATHPNLIAAEGERYRCNLQARARQLGVEKQILWENRFLETSELLDQLEACDIYVTPYPNLQQSTSGTLSYAVALGKAVVSTPYVHARELLDDGIGILVQPDSSTALASAIVGLLDDPVRLAETQRRAYAKGRATIWPEFAQAGSALVRNAVQRTEVETPAARPGSSSSRCISMR